MEKLKRIIIVVILAIIIITILGIFLKKDNNMIKNGNKKTIKEIEEYFLNIDSYKANLSVKIKSNKNENEYQIVQEVKKQEYSKQIVEKPDEIKGMEIIFKDGILSVKNTNLNISKVFNNYPYIYENGIFFTDFIRWYQTAERKYIEEKENKIIVTINQDNNIYRNKYILTIDKKSLKPEKLEIQDKNKESKVYILYNEIEFNI